MGEKFRKKYRIQSHRMPGWDYAGDGAYFITLVTQNRECNLGEICESQGNAMMELSDFGKIVQSEWEQSFILRNELSVDEYIIMPNHLHAIIALEKRDMDGSDWANLRNGSHVETHGRIETHGRASLLRAQQQLSIFVNNSNHQHKFSLPLILARQPSMK